MSSTGMCAVWCLLTDNVCSCSRRWVGGCQSVGGQWSSQSNAFTLGCFNRINELNGSAACRQDSELKGFGQGGGWGSMVESTFNQVQFSGICTSILLLLQHYKSTVYWKDYINWFPIQISLFQVFSRRIRIGKQDGTFLMLCTTLHFKMCIQSFHGI